MPWGASEIFAALSTNAILFASWIVLPAVCIASLRQIVAARRATSDYALYPLEAIELSRATLLCERASNKLEEISRVLSDRTGSLRARYRRRADFRRQHGKELRDLTAYANHLRATIIRIRGEPLKRFKARAHAVSLRFAFMSALAVYGAVFSLLLAVMLLSKPPWLELLAVKYALIGQATQEPLMYVNVIASGFAIAATPLSYLLGRAGLGFGERVQVQLLKEFATPDPKWLFHRKHQDETANDKAIEQHAPDATWPSILGVSPSATIEEVKEAYKLNIKKNHPDRVHGMAAIFKNLAEAETKKLNAAYEEAILSLNFGQIRS
jgi:hypothetical protein